MNKNNKRCLLIKCYYSTKKSPVKKFIKEEFIKFVDNQISKHGKDNL